MKFKEIWRKLLKSEIGLIFKEKGQFPLFIPQSKLLDLMRNYVEGSGSKIKLIELILPFYDIKRGDNWWYIIPSEDDFSPPQKK